MQGIRHSVARQSRAVSNSRISFSRTNAGGNISRTRNVAICDRATSNHQLKHGMQSMNMSSNAGYQPNRYLNR